MQKSGFFPGKQRSPMALFVFFTAFLMFMLSSDSNRTVFKANRPRLQTIQRHPNPSLRFEQNQGQTDRRADFLCRGRGHVLFVNATEAVLKFQPLDGGTSDAGFLFMKLLGADPNARGSGLESLPSKSNYFIGNDPSTWRTGVPHFAKVRYGNVYDGIDLVYYVRDNIEFDFLIDPGADPDAIRLAFHPADRVELNGGGDLVVHAGSHQSRFPAPRAFQEIEGTQKTVEVRYIVEGNGGVHFALGSYDGDETLVIDPQWVYATYLGGGNNDAGYGIAADESGHAYVTGSTTSTDFPVKNAHQGGLYPGSTASDMFVTKMNPEGTDRIYSTYLGSKTGENPEAIAVDAKGRACITGRTNAGYAGTEGFPLKNALQSKTGDGQNAFVTVLDPSGGLYYSTFLGGTQDDYGKGIAVDASGCVYVTGSTFSFPPEFPIKNAFMAKKPGYYYDPFMTKIDPSKSGDASLVYSTYLGGKYDDYGNGIAVDGSGCAYVTGSATEGFPTTPNAVQPAYKGKGDVFVAKIDPSKSGAASLVYSTFLGNEASNEGLDIEADASGCAYVCGYGPVNATPGAFTTGGYSFICKLHESGNGFIYSARVNSARRLAVDGNGSVYATFFLDLARGGGVIALNPDGTDTLFTQKTFVTPADVAVDADGFVYVTGSTNSPDFTTTAGSYQPKLKGSTDAIVAKLQPKDMLVAKVLSDPIEQEAHPIRNTAVDVYSVDLSNLAAPLTFLARKMTDKKGLLKFPVGPVFQPGMPLLIRAMPERTPAVKLKRTDKTDYMYKVYVDNLIINPDGLVSAQPLESDPADTTRVHLCHTSIGFGLVVSIEWLSSFEYITNLISAFRKVSNMLYDVTNGQAFIDTVAIFDNYDLWEEADMRIHANNLQWPGAVPHGNRMSDAGACIYLPPAFYNNAKDSSYQVQDMYDVDPVDPSVPMTFKTMVHELGHYLLGFRDEYEKLGGEDVFANPSQDVNFGFMDDPSPMNDLLSTEMSDYRPGDAWFNDYRLTEHFQGRGMNCWDYFENMYERTYGDVAASIHRPRDIGIFPNNVMRGPNSSEFHPDFSVGGMMDFDVRAVMTTNPRRSYQFMNEQRRPVAGAMVGLRKKGWWIHKMEHGVTTVTGHIKLFNAEAGDYIYATHNQNDKNWRFVETLVESALQKAGSADAETIEMKTVSGRFSILSAVGFDVSGGPVYQCQADPPFASPPSIEVSDDVSTSEKQVLSASAGAYSAALSKPGFSGGSVVFYAPDSLGKTFFISQNASVGDVSGLGYMAYFDDLQLELAINQAGSTAQKAALLASAFPAPMTGLPESVRRVSDVIALNVYPAGSDIKGQIQLQYYADSLAAVVPEAVQLYQWQNGWVPLATGVNLVRNTVSAALDGPGYYAAFLDLTRSRVVTGVSKGGHSLGPSDWMLHPNYPNPFNPSTRIPYDVPNRSHVSIEVFDMLGRKIRTVVDRVHAAGSYIMLWDGRDERGASVPAGIYVYRIQTGQFSQSRKMVLMR